MHASSDQLILIPAVAAPAAVLGFDQTPSGDPDAFYRRLGLAVTAGISASFWMTVLAMALPAIGIVPSMLAIGLTGAAIAATVCATLVALQRNI